MIPTNQMIKAVLQLDERPVIEVQNAFPEYLRTEILHEFKKHKDKFTPTPHVWGKRKVRQEFNVCHINERIKHLFPATNILTASYESIDKKIKQFFVDELDLPLYETTPEVWVQQYWKGSAGIDLHKDESSKLNYIAIAVIEGTARFGYAQSPDDGQPQLFEAKKGSMLFLRAPQPQDTQDLRPYHFVEPCKEERYSIVFRNMKK